MFYKLRKLGTLLCGKLGIWVMFLLNIAAVVWLLGIDTPTKKNSYQVPNHEVF